MKKIVENYVIVKPKVERIGGGGSDGQEEER